VTVIELEAELIVACADFDVRMEQLNGLLGEF
jgi:hypothetical protein